MRARTSNNNDNNNYLDGVFVVLFGAEEERAVHQRVPVEHEHQVRAQHAIDSRLVLGGQRRQYERSGLVVAVIAFVFDLCEHRKKKYSILVRDVLIVISRFVWISIGTRNVAR